MGRAEHSHDVGDLFRRRVESILQHLRYDILASKHPIKCKCEYHKTAEHTIDILARHMHASESMRKSTILVESKKTMPSLSAIEKMVIDIANKMDCLRRYTIFSEVSEGLVLSETDTSLAIRDAFSRAARKIASSRDALISLVSGPRFRIVEGMSITAKRYSGKTAGSSISIVNSGKHPNHDIGSLCPLNIDSLAKCYLCGLKLNKFRISVFKLGESNYNSDDFLEDMAWTKKYTAVFDQIHSNQGFTDNVPKDVKSSRLKIGLIDHNLKRTFFQNYLNYQRENI